MIALSERDWQTRVVDLARLRRWRHFHPFDSRRSVAGWPDLTLVRGERLVFAELKTNIGRLTAAQEAWLAALRQVPATEVFVWRPGDWPEVMEVLT